MKEFLKLLFTRKNIYFFIYLFIGKLFDMDTLFIFFFYQIWYEIVIKKGGNSVD